MDSQAFDIDHDCVGTHIFQYNYSHDNAGGFFLLMGKVIRNNEMGDFEKAIIRYNISQNDGNSFPRIFELHDFVDVDLDIQVYNNVFWSGSGTMAIQCKGSYFGGIVFTNNIFYAPNGTYPDLVELNNNIYFPHAAPAHDTSSLNQDPRFINAGSGGEGFSTVSGYQIYPDSPAIGAGKRIPDNGGYDFWGNIVPDDHPPCIGAHQYNKQSGIDEKDFRYGLLTSNIYPNPFTDSVFIHYCLQESTYIRIDILDQSGRPVKCLLDDRIASGDHLISWDTSDNSGRMVTPGFYYCSIKSDQSIICHKMIVL
jgi:hypothetical protein